MHLFSLKIPRKEPIQIPSMYPHGVSCLLLGICYVPFKLLIKFPLNKENFPFYRRP